MSGIDIYNFYNSIFNLPSDHPQTKSAKSFVSSSVFNYFASMNKPYKILILLISFHFCLNAQEKTDFNVENYQKIGSDEAVRSILIDKQNYKWLGTDRGLYRMISMDHDPEIFSKDSIMGLAEDKKEVLWYGNRSQQLQTEDKLQNIVMEKTKAQISGMGMAYYKGDLWVGTDDGLFRVSDDQGKILNHYTIKNSKLNSNQINFVYADNNDRLWVGTDAGIVKIENKDWDSYEKNHQFTGAISTIEGVWLLSVKQGWLVFQEDGRERWQDIGVKRGLSQGPIRAIASDSKGRIYIASEILVQFDPDPEKETIIKIDEDYGFVSSQTLSIAVDKNDDLWVGTADRGLFRIDVIDGKDEKFSVIAYSKGELKCTGAKTAEIIVIAKGGKTPYSYSWNVPGLKGSKNDSLGAGEYKIVVTDAEGEEFESNIVIKDPEPIQISVISKTPVTEVGRRNGKATIEITGGLAPYRVLWSNGKTALSNTTLAAGKQNVKVIDQNNCPQSLDIVIEQPKVIADLDRKKITVGQTLQINQLFFTADSSLVNAESYAVLDEIFSFLSTNKDVVVEIGGHTNNIPPHEYCDRLSSARAKNVADYLIEKGIPANQVQHKGYGKRVPIASNDTAAGRQKNQRVELKIISMK
jgi:outer membrane protein OmpA-like peptidoglycan-associated protein